MYTPSSGAAGPPQRGTRSRKPAARRTRPAGAEPGPARCFDYLVAGRQPPLLPPGADDLLDVERLQDHRRPVEVAAPGPPDPLVDLLDGPAYRCFGLLRGDRIHQVFGFLAEHQRGRHGAGDVFAPDEVLEPPFFVIGSVDAA